MPEAANDTLEEKPSFALRVGERYIPQKMEKPAFACVACVRMPEAASVTSAEKPSSASRVGRHCILKKRRRSLPLPASRVRMLEAASDALAKKPSFALRVGERYIPKRWRSLPLPESRAGERRKRPEIHRRKTPRSRHAKEGGTSLKDGEACPSCLAHGRMPEVASDTLAEKPSSALRAGGRCILKKRKRSLPHTSRVEDRFQQTALHRREKPLSALRERAVYPQKMEKPTLVHVMRGRAGALPVAGKPGMVSSALERRGCAGSPLCAPARRGRLLRVRFAEAVALAACGARRRISSGAMFAARQFCGRKAGKFCVFPKNNLSGRVYKLYACFRGKLTNFSP